VSGRPAGLDAYDLAEDAQCELLPAPSTAPCPEKAEQRFRICHPFHPRNGDAHGVAFTHRSWGEDRIYFRGEDGRLWSVHRALTDLRDPDAFVAVSEGRAVLSLAEALTLAGIIRDLAAEGERGDV
jgi:hypothetical protein